MVRIWSQRDDACWLYVEQAVAEHQDRPYRQRVYRIRQVAEGLYESSVFTPPEPERLVGAWTHEEPLAELAPADLAQRDGCAILMRRRGDAFIGGTLGRLCTSQLRGAAYATSDVIITADRVVSWDRGFDADNHQVWGAENGGYVFVRTEVDTPAPEDQPTTPVESEE
jgi:hypothetical protein